MTSYLNRDQAFLDVTLAIKSALREVGADAVQPRAQRDPVAADSLGSAVPEPNPVSPAGPRSSNLRIRQEFSQRDRDRFLRGSFDLIAQFFENSLRELGQRHDSIETDFHRVDGNTFTAVVYRDGSAEAQCTIWTGARALGRFGGAGIFYSEDLASGVHGSISYNEHLSVGADDQKLYLEPQGSFSSHGDDDHLTQAGAAEYLWDRLIGRIQ